MRKNTCQKCAYFDLTGGNLCRVDAPKYRHDTGCGAWPTVSIDDWCGRFFEQRIFESYNRTDIENTAEMLADHDAEAMGGVPWDALNAQDRDYWRRDAERELQSQGRVRDFDSK